MSTYSNNPQQNMWERWFVTSVILLLPIVIWGTNDVELPVIYDLLLAAFVNLIYCIVIGFKTK